MEVTNMNKYIVIGLVALVVLYAAMQVTQIREDLLGLPPKPVST